MCIALHIITVRTLCVHIGTHDEAYSRSLLTPDSVLQPRPNKMARTRTAPRKVPAPARTLEMLEAIKEGGQHEFNDWVEENYGGTLPVFVVNKFVEQFGEEGVTSVLKVDNADYFDMCPVSHCLPSKSFVEAITVPIMLKACGATLQEGEVVVADKATFTMEGETITSVTGITSYEPLYPLLLRNHEHTAIARELLKAQPLVEKLVSKDLVEMWDQILLEDKDADGIAWAFKYASDDEKRELLSDSDKELIGFDDEDEEEEEEEDEEDDEEEEDEEEDEEAHEPSAKRARSE